MVRHTATMPDEYVHISQAELDERLKRAKDRLGGSTVILGHHYQRDEVVRYADFLGDSFKLSQLAAGRREAKYIVFCGVHFMAESADILSGRDQAVILPDLTAGCSMADMASRDQVEDCWEDVMATCREDGLVPITYVNSSAAIKAFVGEKGGAVCTSSNARAVVEWALERGDRILFVPDQHLGRNTALKMGISDNEMVVWNPDEHLGGSTIDDLRRARVILWHGYCSVHARFSTGQIELLRRSFPGIRVIVHPECKQEVVALADEDGSTEHIIRRVTESEPGSSWAIGTEIHLVNRLKNGNPDKLVMSLDDCACMCSTMFRIDPQHLLWVMESLLGGEMVNRIQVDDSVARWARQALDRMLSIK